MVQFFVSLSADTLKTSLRGKRRKAPITVEEMNVAICP